MSYVRSLANILTPDPTVTNRWYVSDGSTAVGPVELELLARGVEAGAVPPESFVRHEAWKVWRPLRDLATFLDEPESGQPASLGAPPSAPPSLSDAITEVRDRPTDDITAPGRPPFADETSAADALAGASDLKEALLLLLTTALHDTNGEAGLVHQLRDAGATVVCAHGPLMFDVLGARTPLMDPALVAAAAASTVVAEPAPGPAGQAILGRMARLGAPGEGAFMVPLRPHGRLLGAIEIGRGKPFRASDVAAVEALVDALAHQIEAGALPVAAGAS